MNTGASAPRAPSGTRTADFRSDTVTKPSAAMREAMASAAVGDDVFADDPTVLELERLAASMFGKEAGLFVPSGTQGNQIAVRLHTSPGQEVAVGENSHSLDWELAGLAALCGVQARAIAAPAGCVDVDAARVTLRHAGGFRPACRLLIVENTHNFCGGSVVPLDHLRALWDVVSDAGASLHLDGARIWNASVASDTTLADYGALCHTMMVCLSKGIGAPVGSLLLGSGAAMAEARENRKLLGGGMRQIGVLAAPALIGLADYRERLADDHRRASSLAAALDSIPSVSLPLGVPETNILFVQVNNHDAREVQAALAAAGVLAVATAIDQLRFVTHCDVDDDDVKRAARAMAYALKN